MDSNHVIHGLWIGSELSPLEILTIRSFIANGHRFILWAYDDIKNCPGQAEIKDATQIIPRDRIFRYEFTNAYGHGKGSYAGFSDIFRYKLLYDQGGIYVDMDVTCLKPLDFGRPYVFRYHHKFGAVGNVLKCPPGSEVMDWCYNQAVSKVDAANRRWELPIEILNEGIDEFDLGDNIISISNNDSWPLVAGFVSGDRELPQDWYVIHWMNEEWRRLKLKKDSVIEGSVLAELYKKYEQEIGCLSGMEAMRARIRLSRGYYAMVNLRHRIAR